MLFRSLDALVYAVRLAAVAGPYLELFARQTRPGWTCWGNEVGKFDQPKPEPQHPDWDSMWSRPFDYPERI